jgi:predicted patatin/cPLA2 family phospholipase
MLYNAALVLEGGAFRGQYTAGVVDTFLAHHIEFDNVIGVSAGSLCGANFVSKQYGRAAMININHRHDRDYISFSHLLHRQTIINLDYLFEDHGWRWENFNERAYERSASNFTAVATSMVTGKAVKLYQPGRRRPHPGPQGFFVDADHREAAADEQGPVPGRRGG